MRRHYGRIYGFLLHLSGEMSAAEDLTQETFAAAWASISSFRGRASIGTWLHRIAYGKFIDFKRRSKRGQAVAEQLRHSNGRTRSVRNPLDEVIARERSGRVYAAVGELEPADREVIVLHYFQGLSFRQMGTVLDEPVGTVKWRTSQALGRLKVTLDGRV
ncbi:MAG: RNA polymerase sigma factor [Phycisphaerae bacterium]|nr:RNA polymerase sigma factor [Phycisphaerae bacterium]